MKSIFQRLKGKNFRDFVVYGKRKFYLEKVRKNHAKYGYDYYFSENYIKKHCRFGDLNLLAKNFLNSNNGLFGDGSELRSRLNEFSISNQHSLKSLTSYADRAILHRFNLLGSGFKNLNFPFEGFNSKNTTDFFERTKIDIVNELLDDNYSRVDWHVDFKTGYRWCNNQYYPESRNYVTCLGADIKVPWELSRAQHLPSLAIAYLLTNKSEYAEEVYSQIIDWISYNPLCKGPNWNCPMDVGIRAANWLVALELVKQYKPSENLKKLEFILASLIQHLDYLWNNFEWTSKLTSNHYLSDIAGFLFCVVYIPELKKKSVYQNFVRTEFSLEIVKQFYQDGMNAEGSLPYHRLVLELFAYSFELAQKNEIDFGVEFKNRLAQSFFFTEAVMTEQGSFPQIGDNDSGIFLKFNQYKLSEYSYLNRLAVFLQDPQSRVFSGATNIENVLFGSSEEKSRPDKKELIQFKESGISVIKTPSVYLAFYHGRNGQKGNGGHCHNDRLSFTLNYLGQELITDPGTGVYTANPEKRNLFRSTQYHSTVCIDSREQNEFYSNGYLFGCHEDILDIEAKAKEYKKSIQLIGVHNGYKKLNYNAKHRREINFLKKENLILIRDIFPANCKKEAIFIFKNHSGLKLSEREISSPFFKMDFEGASKIKHDMIEYSPAYGEFESDGCLRVKILFQDELVTSIQLIEDEL